MGRFEMNMVLPGTKSHLDAMISFETKEIGDVARSRATYVAGSKRIKPHAREHATGFERQSLR